MLVVSELSEADEGYNGGQLLYDDKLPHRFMIEVELADAKIRIADIGGARNLNLSGAAINLMAGDHLSFGCANPTACLMAIVNEVSRAMEGHRKNADDAALPHRKAFEVGLAAALLRIHRLAALLCLDVDGAVVEKRAFNRIRADHRPENRVKVGGKRY
jgi:hypothetical protein